MPLGHKLAAPYALVRHFQVLAYLPVAAIVAAAPSEQAGAAQLYMHQLEAETVQWQRRYQWRRWQQWWRWRQPQC